MRSRHFLALPVLLAGLMAPASAAAWTVTVHVHGAGKVEEVPNRFGEEKHQLDCSVPPGGKAEWTVTDCVGGSTSGLWNNGNIVKLRASVPPDSTARGWRTSHYVDGNAANQINCDPQSTTGPHSGTDCEFQIFANLYIDLYFDDIHGPTDTGVTGGPSSATNLTAPTFNFDAPSDPDATFECQLDRPSGPGTFAPCGGPADKSEQYSLTADGPYTFHVKSSDPSGNAGSDTTNDSRSFTLDTTPPAAPSITSAPAPESNDTSPTFAFGSESGASFQCALDSDAYSACSSPHTYPGPLADGAHTFKVRAFDSLGNGPGAVTTHRWTVDTVAPDTTLLSGPAAGSSSNTSSATFTFSSPDSGATFQCRIDAEAFAPCTSPHSRTGLANGDRTLEVRAVDAAGNADPSPASRTWTVNLRDADRDGHNSPQDCDDGNAAIHPGAVEVMEDGIDQDCDSVDAVNLDRDGDGHARPSDCDDTKASVHPGARDTPGNKVDEDCSGSAAPFPRLASSVRSFFAFPPLRFTTLTIVSAVKGSRIELRCRGGGCFKRKVITVRKSRSALSVLRYVRGARLRRGTVVYIRITQSGHIGFLRRVTSRGSRRTPRIEDFCLTAGKNRAKKSC